MIRSSRRSAGRSRAVLAALVATGATVLAGCQAGQQAQTSEQIPTIDGNYAQVGSLALRDVTIEYPERGSWPQGSDARLRLIVVNEGRDADRLVEVRSDVADRVTFGLAGGETEASPSATATATPTPSGSPSASESPDASGSPSATTSATATATATAAPTPTEEAETSITIPAAGLIALRDDGPEILLSGLTRVLRPAQVVPVTFVFEQAGEVTVEVAVATPTEEVSLAPTVPVEEEGEE